MSGEFAASFFPPWRMTLVSMARLALQNSLLAPSSNVLRGFEDACVQSGCCS